MRNGILALAAALALSAAAHAQQWPAKPVRVIVNVAPGGVADVTMRVLGARLTETMGQAFIVENRAGGDGYIGFEAVATTPEAFAERIRADIPRLEKIIRAANIKPE